MRKSLTTLLVTGFTGGVCLLAPQAAAAPLPIVASCPAGTSTVTYTPGVTDESTLQYQEGTEESGPCYFVPFGLSRTFATEFGGTIFVSCTELLSGEDSGTQTFVWNDGLESYWEFESITSQTIEGNTISTLSGTLSQDSEFLPGVTVVQVVTYPDVTIESCADEPLTEVTGTSTYVFYG